MQLFDITSKLGTMDFAADLTALQWFTWIKWGSLALVFLTLVPYFFRGGKFSMTIAGFGIVCFALAVISFFHRSAFNEMFGALTAVMFLLMIVYCFIYKQEPDSEISQ